MTSSRPTRGHRRGAAWTHVTYGVHRPATEVVPSEHPPFWSEDDLAGWQLLMTGHGCFTGLTALQVWGLPLPPLPQGCPVFLALAKDDPRPMRAGVHTSRHIRPVTYDVVHGLRVAEVAEALAAAGRWVGLIDLVAMVDAALHLGLVSMDSLELQAGSRRPGSRQLRAALSLVDGHGVLIARADLRLCGTNSLHEFDGDEHEESSRRVHDRRRDRRVDRENHVRRGDTAGDVIQRAVTILEDADRAVGRPHDPSRIRAWHDLLRESLFTAGGRTAFLARIPQAPARRRTA